MGGTFTAVKAASASTIEITFKYKGKRCRERLKLKPTAANLKRASRHREAVVDAIETGAFDYAATFPNSKRVAKFSNNGPETTTGTFLTNWLEDKKPTLKASTYEDYLKTIKNRLVPEFGDIPLADLRRADVREWVSGLDCSRKRIANLISPLRSALEDAVEDDYIQSNPLAGWSYKKKEQPKAQHVEPLTREEQSAILAAATGQFKNLVQFAIWSGLRTSEMIGLLWDDIDFIESEIRVSKAETAAAIKAATNDDERKEKTKTVSGDRTVKMLPPAREALLAQRKFTALAGERVFHHPKYNKPWSGDKQIRESYWRPLLKKAGVSYRNPYQTRHTYASMMLSAGEPLAWVANQMGHSDTHMTTKAYARWVPNALPKAGNKAVKMFTQ
ncbi:MAG: hypothetical protein B6I36_07665 [Desulfobacteraceae bacterium 4572_35.1]|nr:MAG: hypothetical protein B6I36_07665 [Desulfobacteraceae bacterium 4572_35.1]